MYNEKILNELDNLIYLKAIKGSNITVLSEPNEFNDIVKFYAQINKDDVIQKISYRASGCTHFLVFCNYFCSLVDGKKISDALAIKDTDLYSFVDLDDSQKHIVPIILDAFKVLIDKYREGVKNGKIVPTLVIANTKEKDTEKESNKSKIKDLSGLVKNIEKTFVNKYGSGEDRVFDKPEREVPSFDIEKSVENTNKKDNALFKNLIKGSNSFIDNSLTNNDKVDEEELTVEKIGKMIDAEINEFTKDTDIIKEITIEENLELIEEKFENKVENETIEVINDNTLTKDNKNSNEDKKLEKSTKGISALKSMINNSNLKSKTDVKQPKEKKVEEQLKEEVVEKQPKEEKKAEIKKNENKLNAFSSLIGKINKVKENKVEEKQPEEKPVEEKLVDNNKVVEEKIEVIEEVEPVKDETKNITSEPTEENENNDLTNGGVNEVVENIDLEEKSNVNQVEEKNENKKDKISSNEESLKNGGNKIKENDTLSKLKSARNKNAEKKISEESENVGNGVNSDDDNNNVNINVNNEVIDNKDNIIENNIIEEKQSIEDELYTQNNEDKNEEKQETIDDKENKNESEEVKTEEVSDKKDEENAVVEDKVEKPKVTKTTKNTTTTKSSKTKTTSSKKTTAKTVSKPKTVENKEVVEVKPVNEEEKPIIEKEEKKNTAKTKKVSNTATEPKAKSNSTKTSKKVNKTEDKVVEPIKNEEVKVEEEKVEPKKSKKEIKKQLKEDKKADKLAKKETKKILKNSKKETKKSKDKPKKVKDVKSKKEPNKDKKVKSSKKKEKLLDTDVKYKKYHDYKRVFKNKKNK